MLKVRKSDISEKRICLGIIGAGVSGLSAALFAAQNGIQTTIFDQKTGGGRAGGIPYIQSFPGLEKDRVKGTEFVKRLKNQIVEYTEIDFHEFEPVEQLKKRSKGFKLVTKKMDYEFDFIILAMGVEHKRLNILGETEFSGRGVSYCAACDGLFFKNKDTIVIGNDTHALEQALFLNDLDSNVTLLNPDQDWHAEPRVYNDLKVSDIRVLEDTSVSEIIGERMVSGVKVAFSGDMESKKRDKNETVELEAKGIFISVGFKPRIELILNSDLKLELSEDGHIIVDKNYQTKIPNLFAIGDLTSPDLEILNVCASGTAAVKQIIKTISKVY